MASILESIALRFKPVLSKRVGVALGLWGEAGIGKTYSVRQLLGQIQCRSFSLHATVPLAQLVDTLPGSKRLEIWAETILKRVSKGEHVPNDTAADALTALLTKLAPVVVHLEDLHEANAERLELIQQLSKRIRHNKGVGLLLTSRGELPDWVEGMRLQPLLPEASKALLEQQAGGELPAEACNWIFARAAGNPLFTIEYLRHLTRMGNLWSDGQRWHWRTPQTKTMPLTVEALLEQTLNQVTVNPNTAKLLFSMALLPKEASLALIEEFAQVGPDEARTAQQELGRRGVLSGEDFSHPLFREVALQTLPKAERKALSRRAVDLFVADPVQAATYAEDAGLPAEQTFSLLCQAAKAASSDNQVGRFLLRALKYVSQEERQSFTLEVAQTIRDTDTATAIGLLEQVLLDHPGDVEAIYTLSNLLARGFNGGEAKAVFARLPLEEQRSQRGRVAWLETLAYFQGDAETIRLWREEFAHNTSDPKVVGAVANAMSRLEQFAEAIQLCQQALEQPNLDPWERIRLTNTLGTIYNDSSQHPLAEPVFSQVIALMEQHGLAQRKFVPLYNRALSRKWVGRFGEAVTDLEESYKLAAEAGQPHSVAQALSLLGEQAFEQGRYQGAEDLLHQSAAIYAQRSVSNHTVDVYNNLVSLYLEWPAPHSGLLALKYAHKAVEAARSLNNPAWLGSTLTSAMMVEVVFGSLAKALGLLEEAQLLIEEVNTPHNRYLLDWAKARIALKQNHPEQALVLLQQALAIAAQLHHVLDAHKLGLEVAHVSNDLKAAQENLEWFEQNGLGHGVNLAHRLFPELTNSAARKETVMDTASIRLGVLGPLQIEQGGQTQLLRGRKRQELLAMLLETRLGGRLEVSKLELLEQLYPEEDELKANSALKQLISSLREMLGENAILTIAAGYALGAVDSDAEAFLQTGNTALWRGAYLEDLDTSSSVADSLYLALKLKAEENLSSDPTEAARLGRILLQGDPYNLEHLKLCLLALRATGNYKTLGRAYQEARIRMQEVGHKLPEKWAEFLS